MVARLRRSAPIDPIPSAAIDAASAAATLRLSIAVAEDLIRQRVISVEDARIADDRDCLREAEEGLAEARATVAHLQAKLAEIET